MVSWHVGQVKEGQWWEWTGGLAGSAVGGVRVSIKVCNSHFSNQLFPGTSSFCCAHLCSSKTQLHWTLNTALNDFNGSCGLETEPIWPWWSFFFSTKSSANFLAQMHYANFPRTLFAFSIFYKCSLAVVTHWMLKTETILEQKLKIIV